MTNSPPYPHGTEESQHESVPTTPRWVKVFAVLALVAVVLFIVLMLAGGHGPPEGGH